MMNRLSLYACLISATCTAQTLTTVRMSSETAPSGGMAQLKLLLTSPMPIITGNGLWDLSAVSFDSIDGINLFSATGDVAGAAVVSGSQFNLRFISPNGTFGTNVDYPIMTAAVRLSSSCVRGQVMPVSLDAAKSLLQTTNTGVQFEYKAGAITVGGSVSITDVIPGGGIVPEGSTFSILGMNFTPKTSISIRGIAVGTMQYVSPTEFRVTVKKTGRLDGALIQAKNPDGSQDQYYSYMRGISAGQSTRALLNKTVAILPMNPASEATLPPTVSPVNADYFTAIALQNSGQATAVVTVEARGGNGALLASTQIPLAPRYKIQREVSELFGTALPIGGYLHVVANQAVQMMGLLGNDSTNVVLPLSMNVVSAPATVAIGK